MSKPLEDYGSIGNTISAALVAKDGSMDRRCLPRFDSAPCFAALLGTEQHGRWLMTAKLRSAGAAGDTYRTAVLETTFETDDGEVKGPTSCRSRRTRKR